MGLISGEPAALSRPSLVGHLWDSAVRTTVAFGLLLALARLAGFARESITAYFFGASTATDAYYAATALPELAAGILLSGLLAYVILPALAGASLDRGIPQTALLEALLAQVMVAGLLAAWALVLFAGPLLHLTAPGLGEAARAQAEVMLRICSPSVLCYGLASLAAGTLNARRSFLSAPIAILIGNGAGVIVLLVSARAGPLALAYAYLAAAVVTATVQCAWLIPYGGLPIPKRASVLFAGGGILASGLVATAVTSLPYLRVLIERLLASQMAHGDLAALSFASKVVLFVCGVIAVPIGTVVFPRLAERARTDLTAFHSLLARTLFVGVTGSLVATAVLVIFGDRVVALLFERGAFDAHATSVTISIVQLYAIGIGGMTAVDILVRSSFALGLAYRGLTVLILALAATVVLQVVAGSALGVKGIALGTSTGAWIGTALMGWLTWRQRKHRKLSC